MKRARLIIAAVALLAGLWACPAAADQVAKPEFEPPSGATVPATVTITCTTTGTVIHYTLDGLLPTTNSPSYAAPVAVTEPAVLRARAFRDGFDPSKTTFGRYVAPWVRPGCQIFRSVTNSGPAGLPRVDIQVAPDSNALCVAIEESVSSALVPTNISHSGVWLPGPGVLRWPTLGTNLTLAYDLVDPVNREHELLGTRGSVNGEVELSSVSVWLVPAEPDLESFRPGDKPGQVAAPLFEPGSGPYVPTNVTVTCTTANAEIRYTLDGSLPDETSDLTAGTVNVTTAAVLRARCFKAGSFPSPARAAHYTVPEPPLPGLDVVTVPDTNLPPPVILDVTPDSGVQCWAVEAELPPGLTASNVTAGGRFDAADSVVRWGAYRDDSPRTLRFEAHGRPGTYLLRLWLSVDGRGGWADEDAEVTVPAPVLDVDVPSGQPEVVATPVLDPAGSDWLPVSVTGSCATAGAVIRYTTDGTLPHSGSAVFTPPLYIAAPALLRVRAFKTGLTSSKTVVARYGRVTSYGDQYMIRSVTNNQTYMPQIMLDVYPGSNASCYAVVERLPAGLEAFEVSHNGRWSAATREVRWGGFRDTQIRKLTYSVAGLSGDYRLDGDGSVDGHDVPVTGEDAVTIDLSVRPQVAAPVFDPPVGTPIPVTVTISCITPDASIHYTIDGREPTPDSPVYGAPLRFITTTMLRARAYRALMRPSEKAEAVYTDDVLADDTTLRRVIFSDGSVKPQVQLEARPGGDVRCYAVSESLPAGLTPENISHGGDWRSGPRRIRWGMFRDQLPRDLTYEVTGPDGEYPLTAWGSFNGLGLEATGRQEVRIQHDALTERGVSNAWTFNTETRIDVAPRDGTLCYAVEEYLPEGVIPLSISHTGVWSEAMNVIRWGTFRDGTPREFSYRVSGPPSVYETLCRVSVNGVSQWIRNASEIASGLPPPSDVVAVAGDRLILLSWHTTGHESGVRLFYWTAPDRSDEQNIDLGFAPPQPYALSGLTNGIQYYAALTVYDTDSVESARSATVSAVPNDGSGSVGLLYLDALHYATTDDVAVVTLEDHDLNVHAGVAETATVAAVSSTDAAGIPVQLRETGPNSGVFTTTAAGRELGFTLGPSDAGQGLLQAGDGGTITVRYWDVAPYGWRQDSATFGDFDSDGDGVWDTWERVFLGNLAVTDGSGDPDEDGATDYEESIMGTDPRDGDSVLRFTRQPVKDAQGRVVLRWLSAQNRLYDLDDAGAMGQAFAPIAVDISAAPPTNELHQAVGPGADVRFYRLRVRHPAP